MESWKTQIGKTILRRLVEVAGDQGPWLQIILQSDDNQNNVVLAEKQAYRPVKQNWEPEINPYIHEQLIFEKGAKDPQGRKESPFNK